MVGGFKMIGGIDIHILTRAGAFASEVSVRAVRQKRPLGKAMIICYKITYQFRSRVRLKQWASARSACFGRSEARSRPAGWIKT